jgi:hypothetical protein
LPHQSQDKSGFSIDDIDTTDADELGLELVSADIDNIVAILDDVDAGVGLVGVLLPVDQVRPQSVDHLQEDGPAF